MNLFEFLFPEKCINCKKFGSFLCANCFSKIEFNENFVCPVCTRSSSDGITHPNCRSKYTLDGCIPAVVYKNVVKKLINQYKNQPNLKSLDKLIGKIMCESLSQNESFYKYCELNPLLVPMPLSAARLRMQGYNHAELLSIYVAQYFRLKTSSKIMCVKDAKSQYKLSHESRIKNQANTFEINHNISKIPENVILVDDIATRFTTLKEAAVVLKQAGVRKVIAITFAQEI